MMKILRAFMYVMLLVSVSLWTACSSDDNGNDLDGTDRSQTDDSGGSDGLDLDDLDFTDGTATAMVDFIDEDEEVDFSATESGGLLFYDIDSFRDLSDGGDPDEDDLDVGEVLILGFEDDNGLEFSFVVFMEEIKFDSPYEIGNFNEDYAFLAGVKREEDDGDYHSVFSDSGGEETASEGALIIEEMEKGRIKGSFEMNLHKPNDDFSEIKEVEITKGEFDAVLYQFEDGALLE